jgi:hypothetical protein
VIRALQANNEGDRSDAVAFCVQGVGHAHQTGLIRERHVEACPSTEAMKATSPDLRSSSSDSRGDQA